MPLRSLVKIVSPKSRHCFCVLTARVCDGLRPLDLMHFSADCQCCGRWPESAQSTCAADLCVNMCSTHPCVCMASCPGARSACCMLHLAVPHGGRSFRHSRVPDLGLSSWRALAESSEVIHAGSTALHPPLLHGLSTKCVNQRGLGCGGPSSVAPPVVANARRPTWHDGRRRRQTTPIL
jgi:hypothetical protein